MKKLKLFAFTLIAFLCLDVISVNAETEIVENLEQYKAAIKNSNTTEIKIGGDETEFDIRRLSDSRDDDAIIVNKNIVLDLNGHTIITGDIPGNTAAIKVFYHGNYTLTIKDSLKTGKIHSYCDSSICSSAPIRILNTNNCNPETDDCDSKLILQDITISTSTNSFSYLMNIGSPSNSSKYNIEISNVNFDNNLKATQLFAHNFEYNPTSPVLNLNIKSINVNENEIGFISKVSGYKVKDILDSTKKELLLNWTYIDPETVLSNFDVSSGFVIRDKSVIDVTFDDTQYGYSSISAKPITIKNNNTTDLEIKSVTVSDTNKFTVLGNTKPTITEGNTDNTSFTIKPVDGLGVGKHIAIITVTDKNDETYTANVTFTVEKADPTYIIPSELKGVVGEQLSTVTLPSGFTWNAENTVLTEGNQMYTGTFTPVDKDNYNTITRVDIPVYVKNKYTVSTDVNGGIGTISSSATVVEGTYYDVIFTPATGYMIDTVKINDEPVTVTSNTYRISNITESKNVVVSYKKLPFTITINKVTGATITPNGTINVLYGDNKEIIITANLGYKLKAVKVNGIEKLPLSNNKVTLTNIAEDKEIVVTVEKTEYDVTNGNGQKHTIGKNEDAVFRIDADKDLFLKAYLNDEELDSAFYTITEGSTIITLKQDFLNNLLPNTYNLRVTFSDGGEATATFVIAQPAEDNPKTGDPIMLSIILGSVSLIGLLGAGLYLKKKNA